MNLAFLMLLLLASAEGQLLFTLRFDSNQVMLGDVVYCESRLTNASESSIAVHPPQERTGHPHCSDSAVISRIAALSSQYQRLDVGRALVGMVSSGQARKPSE